MFGNKKGLEEKLGAQGGTVAWATVIEAHTQYTSGTNYENGPYTVGDHNHMKVTLEVQPEGEPAFEATFHQTFVGRSPIKGFQAKVIYDPNDHSEIAIQDNMVFPPGISHEQAERAAVHDAQMRAAIASGTQAEFIEQDIAARKAEAAARVQQAQAAFGGNAAQYIAQMTAAAAAGGVGGAAPPVTGGAPAQPDLADELTKLANLHGSGVLTDAEFEAAKAKLLAGP
jgi:Short C-terminal domain